jgi:hypothetical protein
MNIGRLQNATLVALALLLKKPKKKKKKKKQSSDIRARKDLGNSFVSRGGGHRL